MKKIILNIVLILGIISLHSCFKEDNEIFDDSSANRLMEAQREYDKLLSAPENGWVMDYYAGLEGGRLGGYQVLCKFDNGQVTIAGAYTVGDYKTIGEKIQSSYTLNRIQGPTLSFATYNKALHPYADPGSMTDPYGYGGDFEFMIMKASKDEFILRGIKQRQVVVMRPMEVGKDWDEYCQDVVKLQEIFPDFTRFSVEKSGQHTGYVTLWAGDNEMHDTDREDIQITKYAVTDRGINLYDSLTVGGNVLKRLIWDKANNKFVDMNATSNVELKPVYIGIDDLAGTYTADADNFENPVTVTLTATDKGTLRVSKEFFQALNPNINYEFEIEVYGKNKFGIKTQKLDEHPLPGGVKVNVTKLAVTTQTSVLFGSSTQYNTVRAYDGSWYRGTTEKPEIRFLQSSYMSIFFPVYIVGVRLLKFDRDTSMGSRDIVDTYKMTTISNIVLTKQ